MSTLKEKLEEVVSVIGIQDLMLKYPFEVSGGQKQRAAVARALITHPSLILADERRGRWIPSPHRIFWVFFGESIRKGKPF